MAPDISELERVRARYAPRLPVLLQGGVGGIALEQGPASSAAGDEQAIRERFPQSHGRPMLSFADRMAPCRRSLKASCMAACSCHIAKSLNGSLSILDNVSVSLSSIFCVCDMISDCAFMKSRFDPPHPPSHVIPKPDGTAKPKTFALLRKCWVTLICQPR